MYKTSNRIAFHFTLQRAVGCRYGNSPQYCANKLAVYMTLKLLEKFDAASRTTRFYIPIKAYFSHLIGVTEFPASKHNEYISQMLLS